jgi:hypothetical protein
MYGSAGALGALATGRAGVAAGIGHHRSAFDLGGRSVELLQGAVVVLRWRASRH